MANKPDIRFNGFSEEWEEKRLGEIYDFLKGKGLSKEKLSLKGKHKCILYGEIFTRYNFEVNECVSATDFEEGEPSVKGDIIMPASTTTDGIDLAKAIHVPENGILYGGDIIVLRPKKTDTVNPYFQATELSSIKREQIASLAQGITIVHLHGYDLAGLRYNMPNVDEQQKIGTFFKTLDELIGAKEEELKKLQQLKSALLAQMFPCEEEVKTTDGGGTSQLIAALSAADLTITTAPYTPNTPRIRFRGFTDPWEKKTINELFILRNGYTPSKANPDYWTNGTIPWFRMDDIREQGHILKDASQHVTPQAVKGAGLFPAGCIIMSTTATIGEHALLIADSLANQRFTVFQTVNRWKTIDMMFFYHYCFILGEWCRRNVNVGGLNAVNISDLRQHKIPFPSMTEQKLIANLLTAQEEKIHSAQQQLQRLRIIKQALLQKMFVA